MKTVSYVLRCLLVLSILLLQFCSNKSDQYLLRVVLSNGAVLTETVVVVQSSPECEELYQATTDDEGVFELRDLERTSYNIFVLIGGVRAGGVVVFDQLLEGTS